MYSVTHFVRAGETLASTEMSISCGGKGYNQTLALCRSGVEVWHAGAVGNDDSEMLIRTLEQNGVHTEFILKKEGSSGHAIIQRDNDGQNCILLYGGANQMVTRQDIDYILGHFHTGDYLIAQNEMSEMPYLIEQAHKRGMKVIFNPSPMDNQVKMYPLDSVDYFILNEIEAQEICEMNQTISGEELAKALARRFHQAKIILTLGDKGAIYIDPISYHFQKAFNVKVIDTTGAGDTFAGFFMGSIILGREVKEALLYASKAAAIAVTCKGAGPSIPNHQQIEQMIVE